MNTIVILIVVGITLSLSVACAILSFYFSTHPASMQVQSDVDELTQIVSKLMKDQRKERMRNVRQGIKAGDEDSQISSVSQAGEIDLLSRGNVDRLGFTDKKALLRARLKGG